MLYVLHITVLCMQHVRRLLGLSCSINNNKQMGTWPVASTCQIHGGPKK